MCNQKYYGEERATTSRRLRLFVSLLASSTKEMDSYFDEEKFKVPITTPVDVKEGHFAVFAVKGSEKKRFVVELEYLNSPEFLSLLQQAEEEYGFEQAGAPVVPCRPEELHKHLGRHDGDYKSL